MTTTNFLVKYNIIFFATTTLMITGCSDRMHEQPSDKYPFITKMKVVVGDDVEIINSLNRAEVQMAYLELPPKSLKTHEIIELLKNDGWIYKGSGVNVDTYCLNSNNNINVASPVSLNATDFKGNKLQVSKDNIDIISYSYNRLGNDMCK